MLFAIFWSPASIHLVAPRVLEFLTRSSALGLGTKKEHKQGGCHKRCFRGYVIHLEILCISSADISLARTKSHDPPNRQECREVQSNLDAQKKEEMEFGERIAPHIPSTPLLSASMWTVLGDSPCVLPCHSLSLVLSSELHVSILSSDLSILSFYAPCYFTSSRDLCLGHYFGVHPSFLSFFPTFPVIL